MIFGVTLYLQTAKGFSPLAAGVMFLGPSLAAAAAGPLSGALGARLPALTVLSLGIATGGAALLALAAIHPLGPFLAILAVSGLGFGLVYAYANVATPQAVAAARAGEASGIVLTMLDTMAGLGVVIAGTAVQAATASGTTTATAIRMVLAAAPGVTQARGSATADDRFHRSPVAELTSAKASTRSQRSPGVGGAADDRSAAARRRVRP
jgi:MFS family permease